MAEIFDLNDPKLKEIILNKTNELIEKKRKNLKRRPYVGQTKLVKDIRQEVKQEGEGFSILLIFERKRLKPFYKGTGEGLFIRDPLFNRVQPFELDKQKLAFTRRANIFKFDRDFDKIVDEVVKYSADVALNLFLQEI